MQNSEKSHIDMTWQIKLMIQLAYFLFFLHLAFLCLAETIHVAAVVVHFLLPSISMRIDFSNEYFMCALIRHLYHV